MSTNATDPLEDPALPALVSAAIERIDRGLDPALDEICSERPDLAAAVAQSLELAQRLPAMQRDSAAHDHFVGRVLDSRYRLDSRLGAGAMGVVYRGEDVELRRPVAIKILRSAFLSGDESELRFAREAEVMAAIRHPSVVTVYDRGQTGSDDPYLVMELLDGETLGDLLEQAKSLSGAGENSDWIAKALGLERLEEPSYLRTVVRWTADLASGLAAAHEAGVFHRDVKPSNVFVRKDGRPMLLDFGIAAHASQATLTREGQALGTPAYMAPESLEADHEPDAALDVYGLGATLYHMLTLHPPFAGTPSQILSSLVTKEPTPAFRLRPGLPRDLQAILDRSMARRPSSRYASAADLEADLRAFLDHRPVSARPVSGTARVWRRVRRSPALLTGLTFATVVLTILGGVQWRRAWIAGRVAEFADVWKQVDPNLTIMSVSNRFVPDPAVRAATGDLLDRAAELCLEPVPARLIRASFLLDHADPRGAADDMAAVARWVDTPYARELAGRYAALPAAASGARDLDTTGLPEPVGAMDAYLAGYHLMRVIRYDEARPFLADPRLEDSVPAEELRLAMLSEDIKNLPIRERVDAAQEMYERVVRLEGRIGHGTATTAHMIGSALLHQESYDLALEAVLEGLALAPSSHQLWMNAGMAAYRGERFSDARENLDRAIELRPNYFAPYTTQIRLLITTGDLDEAERWLDLAPIGEEDAFLRWGAIKQGDIETDRALLHLHDAEPDLAVASGERALDQYDLADSYRTFGGSTRSTISTGIVAGDTSGVFAGIARLMTAAPLAWRRLESLLDWMPEDLSKDQTAALRDYLEALRTVLARDAEYEPMPPPSTPR